MKIALSTDHAGFQRLRYLKSALELAGYKCIDFGPVSFNPEDDYPDYIQPAAESILHGGCQMGIILGGSGQGEAMAANRFLGIRCAVWYGQGTATEPVDAAGRTSTDHYEILRLSREHNDANMLSIASRFVDDEETVRVALLWLNERFHKEDRHVRRIQKLDELKTT